MPGLRRATDPGSTVCLRFVRRSLATFGHAVPSAVFVHCVSSQRWGARCCQSGIHCLLGASGSHQRAQPVAELRTHSGGNGRCSSFQFFAGPVAGQFTLGVHGTRPARSTSSVRAFLPALPPYLAVDTSGHRRCAGWWMCAMCPVHRTCPNEFNQPFIAIGPGQNGHELQRVHFVVRPVAQVLRYSITPAWWSASRRGRVAVLLGPCPQFLLSGYKFAAASKAHHLVKAAAPFRRAVYRAQAAPAASVSSRPALPSVWVLLASGRAAQQAGQLGLCLGDRLPATFGFI